MTPSEPSAWEPTKTKGAGRTQLDMVCKGPKQGESSAFTFPAPVDSLLREQNACIFPLPALLGFPTSQLVPCGRSGWDTELLCDLRETLSACGPQSL